MQSHDDFNHSNSVVAIWFSRIILLLSVLINQRLI